MASHARQVRTLRRPVGFLCALAVVGSLTAALVGGTASATTQPGHVFTLRVELTDSLVRLVPHRTPAGKLLSNYIHSGGTSASFPRGTVIEFVFTNKGTKTYLPAIRVTDKTEADPYTSVKNLYRAKKAITPGGHVSLFGNFYFRGSFQVEKLFHNKPRGGTVKISIY